MIFSFRSLENSVLLRLEKGTSIRRYILQNQELLSVFSFWYVFLQILLQYVWTHLSHQSQQTALWFVARDLLDIKEGKRQRWRE